MPCSSKARRYLSLSGMRICHAKYFTYGAWSGPCSAEYLPVRINGLLARGNIFVARLQVDLPISAMDGSVSNQYDILGGRFAADQHQKASQVTNQGLICAIRLLTWQQSQPDVFQVVTACRCHIILPNILSGQTSYVCLPY